jgi:hypothetical protein
MARNAELRAELDRLERTLDPGTHLPGVWCGHTNGHGSGCGHEIDPQTGGNEFFPLMGKHHRCVLVWFFRSSADCDHG